jgi:uncharacterized pyridoxamine 5'-phosphate oxidase family protein
METDKIFSFLVNEIHTSILATADAEGLPVTAAVDRMDTDGGSLYFLTAKVKDCMSGLSEQSLQR